ncbi:auxin-responsive protein IAA27-like isoform X1 [Glycine soja]|uniref:Auxin-induced protein n=2 Tax=Glycine soja TaxID=3848 RepID=A0A445IEW6_GLYSO|nr:auxin-responsive protein IAA27-like isoform X1 [Glycine soja]KHN32629.1 Auxin-responsive protein IAA27 [Glycine soja]RZB84600.1 Auxin-responsive protein IAA27 [Glycine soja]
MSRALEHDYIGLAENPSMDGKNSSSLNLKETELRLGLPGCESPERKSGSALCLFGKELQNNNNNVCSLKAGAKRGFSDAIDTSSVTEGSQGASALFSPRGGNVGKPLIGLDTQTNTTIKEVGAVPQSAKPVQENNDQFAATNAHAIAPAAKAQVVGWPPIRSFRKNTMASNLTKNNDEAEGKSGFGCLYVKVSMDGAPYLRKVDLKTYNNYMELSSALEKMFSCFSIGQCNSPGLPGKDGLSESSLRDLLHGSEYVLTYEDKDGDWMLVGDVPWEMFTDSCRRLRIMKGSEAIGLAPRAMEKSRSQN